MAEQLTKNQKLNRRTRAYFLSGLLLYSCLRNWKFFAYLPTRTQSYTDTCYIPFEYSVASLGIKFNFFIKFTSFAVFTSVGFPPLHPWFSKKWIHKKIHIYVKLSTCFLFLASLLKFSAFVNTFARMTTMKNSQYLIRANKKQQMNQNQRTVFLHLHVTITSSSNKL